MRLLAWFSPTPEPQPRSYEEIKAAVEQRDHEHIQRLNRVEESLLALAAEAGLEELRRRMETLRDA